MKKTDNMEKLYWTEYACIDVVATMLENKGMNEKKAWDIAEDKGLEVVREIEGSPEFFDRFIDSADEYRRRKLFGKVQELYEEHKE